MSRTLKAAVLSAVLATAMVSMAQVRVTPGWQFAPKLVTGDGTKALPAWTFSAEPSSGWYRAGAGDVRLSVLNTDRIAAGAASTALNGPDGGAYFSVSNGVVLVNSSTLKLASGGTGRGAFATPASDGLMTWSNNAGTKAFTLDANGTPSCSSNCGTSPAVAGTNTAGVVTMGASGVPASGWVLTFSDTWAAAPACTVQSALGTMVVGKMPIALAITTTTLTVTTNGTAPANSDKYVYQCLGVQ